jgi:hypothetical protein
MRASRTMTPGIDALRAPQRPASMRASRTTTDHTCAATPRRTCAVDRRNSAMAGYSKRSLVDKLGIKPGMRLMLLNPPAGYDQTLGPLPAEVQTAERLEPPLDFIHLFTTERAELAERFPALKAALAHAGTLWISWPKGSAKVKTDVNENFVREIGLDHGLVDVKVCAVDEVWSGLKFVYRLKDRSTANA